MDNAMKQKIDKTLAVRPIATAHDVAKAANLSCGEAEGQVYALIPKTQHITLHPGDDLRPFDQFNLWVYAAEGASGNLHIGINCTSQTEGLETRDHFRSGVATQIDWTGWKKCVFPSENFLIIGCPEGWVHVDNIAITISRGRRAGLTATTNTDGGIVGLGSVELEQRECVVGPRLTDEGLFGELNLDLPGLETVKSAVQSSNFETAKKELLAYYRHRREHWHPFDPDVPTDPHFDRTAADRLCDHYIQDQQLPQNFDWRINPIGYLEWMHALNRHSWFNTLITAYDKTRDEKYAEKLNYFLRTWLDQNPEPVDHNGGGDPAWETLSTSIRPRHSWLRIWYALKDSPSLQTDTRIDMLKSFWAHAEHLTRYEGYRNNWFIVESEAIAVSGVMFPEFKRAQTWKTRGYERLSEAIAEQVWPDGAQYEISAGYHAMSGRGFELPYELAIKNNMPVDTLLQQRLEKMYEYTAYTSRPDFSHPSLNDSGGVSGGRTDWAAKGGDLFNRDDLRWVGSAGKRGTRPEKSSYAFQDAGIYTFRSNWSPDAKYLIFDAGAYSAAHQHEDKLSFELCYGSEPLLVDPGIASYMADPWTDYYKHSRAHNTVLIDEGGQTSRQTQTWPQWVRSVRSENPVQLGHGIDYAISQYDAGYEGVAPEDALVHHRAIIFVRPDYYLLFDRVEGHNKHTVEALFHFMPVRVKIDGQRVRTDREGKKNLELAPLNFGSTLTPRLITGQNHPVQGWIANRENMPAPCAIYRKKNADLPLEFGHVMAPFASGRSAGLKIGRIKSTNGHAFKLSWANGQIDIVFWRWLTNGEATFAGYTTNAQGAIIRKNGSKTTYAGAIEGTYLKGKGLDLSGSGLIE